MIRFTNLAEDTYGMNPCNTMCTNVNVIQHISCRCAAADFYRSRGGVRMTPMPYNSVMLSFL